MNRLIITITFIVLLMTFGCQQTTERSAPQDGTNNMIHQVSNKGERPNNESIASHLAKVAASVPQVDEANALIAGPYAVVGIDVDKDLDRSTVGVIKYSVSEALQNDPYGKTAIVIADGDIRQRLINMQTEITDGRPVQGVIDELAAIVGRYMPTVPPMEEDIKNVDEQEEMIPNEDQNELEDIQKEQSTE